MTEPSPDTGAPAGGPVPQVTVVIPCRRIDALAQRCVAACLRCAPAPRIILVPDGNDEEAPLPAAVSVTPLGGVTIAAKRNAGAREAASPFLAFIDSDARPEPEWLAAAVARLQKDPALGAVGGPCIPDDDGSMSRRYVAHAQRSVLVSGPKALYGARGQHPFSVHSLSSCNLVMRRDLFLEVGGMDETLATGEDDELCRRLRRRRLELAYDPRVRVHHRTRALKGFLVQRLVWGMDALQDLRRSAVPGAVLTILPGAFILLALGGALLYLVPPLGALHALAMLLYAVFVLAEAVRCARSLAEIPGTALAILIGNLGGGAGALLRAAGVRLHHERFYRHD